MLSVVLQCPVHQNKLLRTRVSIYPRILKTCEQIKKPSLQKLRGENAAADLEEANPEPWLNSLSVNRQQSDCKDPTFGDKLKVYPKSPPYNSSIKGSAQQHPISSMNMLVLRR